MYLADANVAGIERRRLLYDKSIAVKFDFGSNTSGRLPSNQFLLKFKMFNPVLESRFVGMYPDWPDSWLLSKFSVHKTGIDPI